ncbi:transglutaminase family protein [Paenibacillus sp. LHD-38]|uniref:transglutaminase-like domain-containing protein n=1 Tax=Paenibacillus sp. LHD-38 TaxID=3072143 RepID=UPI00280EAF29|nr:transglutaminase family protein [Paenibacillus sp. LHD-38]MDQ8736262.1 transglutaminase family protein [Paenibacillus sp. LHD-38]
MILTCESIRLEDYLLETTEVDFNHPSIIEKANELYTKASNEDEYVRVAFEFVRDEIAHSWDIQSTRVSRIASEVLFFEEGICYAKSNLLCALLRAKGIPAGFCYQRLTLGNTPDTGYCIHALNAVFLQSVGKWIRLDARGNKPGVDAQFSIDDEILVFNVREGYGEYEYPIIYREPHAKTMDALKRNTNCSYMCHHDLPTSLE